jgi:hypothetical protein
MPIDWTTRDRALSLAYLFEGSYHDENGLERTVHWCGPKGRVGSGLSVPVPPHPGQREAFTPVWEARMTRASMDLNMGNIEQVFGTISDLTFNIDISGGSQAPVPVAGDLLRDIVFGRWKNKPCLLWLLDLDTGDTQIMGKGTLDRNPSSIGPSTFQVVMNIDPIFPVTTRWPEGLVPMSATDQFTYPNTGASQEYAPTQYMLNPDHVGKFIGLNFGDGSLSVITPEHEYVWREIIPYGKKVRALDELYIYAWVSPQRNCYVSELWWENTNGENKPLNASTIETFENLDPAMGPLGTCVRFVIPATTDFNFVWWSPPGGAKSRAVARVKGPTAGQHSSFETDSSGNNPVSLYADTGPVRATLWQIIEDIITGPEYLNRSDVLGTNAITEFMNSVPTVQDPVQYANMACVVPLDPVDKPTTVREALGALANFFPFDWAHRYDPSTQDWRLYPVWRSSFNTPPAYIFTVADMSRTDAPSIAQYDNSDGKYANRVFVDVPPYYGRPTVADTSATSGGKHEIQPKKTEKYEHGDIAEQSAVRENAVVVANVKMKHWLHYGSLGNSSAAWSLGEERSQPQRTIQATHGVRSYRVKMGEAIRYDMVGVNSSVGMVRKMRYNFDLQQVQITTYHIDHSTRRGNQEGNNVANNHKRDTDVPSVD